MTLKERIQLATSIMMGNTELVDVRLKGRVIASSDHITGGGGCMEILGTFSQRGYGGLAAGTVVDIGFTAIQEDSPQQFTFGEKKLS